MSLLRLLLAEGLYNMFCFSVFRVSVLMCVIFSMSVQQYQSAAYPFMVD